MALSLFTKLLSNTRASAGLALILTAGLLCGCGTASARVRGIAPLNLNDNNESTPVKVRFYQLASADKFQAATFESLWVNDKDPLGKDRLADPVVVTVLPGSAGDQPQEVALGDLAAGTRFIGVMALYRKTAPDESRILVVPVDDIGSKVIELNGYGVVIAGKAAEAKPEQPAKSESGSGSAPKR
jgi:type VI secretion system VasD/TssJ family lipoprotein